MKVRGIVAAGHESTARAAESVLLAGGNAFDAVLAAMCAACVSEPVLASLGGGGFLLARPTGQPAKVFDFFVHTPLARPGAEAMDVRPVVVDFGTARQTFHYGPGTIATPGVVRGLVGVHDALGTLPLGEIVAPAVRLAREGVVLNTFQAHIFRLVWPICSARPDVCALYSSQTAAGDAPNTGKTLRFPELADTLEWLAREGGDVFYRGEIARRIVEQSRQSGGCLTARDLTEYRLVEREPLVTVYRGVRVETNPLPACGGLLIHFALRLLEVAGELRPLGFGSLEHLRWIAGVLAISDDARLGSTGARERSLAAPPLERMLEADFVQRYRKLLRKQVRASRGTTHMNVIDDQGNVASLTLSNGEGSGEVVPGTGIMLNNMLGEQDLIPEGLGCWPIDSRMASMMSPTVLEYDDGTTVATGSGGSLRIRSSILQVVVNLIDFAMAPELAVASPRLFCDAGRLSVEGGFDPAVVERLVAEYPLHEVWDRRDLYFGGAHTVESRCSGGFRGAGDARRGGVCLVVG